MENHYIFTSESVGEGHPDKVADAISDAILDACLAQDANSRVACETLVKSQHVVLAGEITTNANLDLDSLVRKTVREIGYATPADDSVFNAETLEITNLLTEQSPDIAQGVDAVQAEGKGHAEQGAGDQGLMFGYATLETPSQIPAPVYYAHELLKELARARKCGAVEWLRPDCKSQIAMEYDGNHKPVRVVNVVMSTQHTEKVTHDEIETYCVNIIKRIIPAELLDEKTVYYINPTGRFVIGGPQGDSGITGRKIIVDTYGGMGRHGGGAFSGKDASKVDRSAAYYARWVAKHIVSAGLADRCEVQVAYAIGCPDPVSLRIDTFGTAPVGVCDRMIERAVWRCFNFKPAAMVNELGLKRPIYSASTHYGHFGKDYLPWEQLVADKLATLQELVSQ